jgi:hypothetical protein
MDCRTKYTFRTKEQYEYVLLNWSKKTVTEISNHLGLYNNQVSAMALTLRKNGFEMPKKIYANSVHDIITDLAKKYNI